ncbi:hypothetical protein D3C81_994350 [compost metagenome]
MDAFADELGILSNRCGGGGQQLLVSGLKIPLNPEILQQFVMVRQQQRDDFLRPHAGQVRSVTFRQHPAAAGAALCVDGDARRAQGLDVPGDCPLRYLQALR